MSPNLYAVRHQHCIVDRWRDGDFIRSTATGATSDDTLLGQICVLELGAASGDILIAEICVFELRPAPRDTFEVLIRLFCDYGCDCATVCVDLLFYMLHF